MDGKEFSPEVPVEVNRRKPRTLVLCFDGTSNEFCQKNTNIIKLYSILKKDTPGSQLCYYQAGIGTYFQPGVVSPFFRVTARILDLAVAWYLSEHIMDGYKFLMQNYHEGDSVCIFGFSRGAYTARALAGMLHKVGLLSKDNVEQIPFAYKMYKSSSHEDNMVAARFKHSFCREVPIEFLGVWDTVASVGVLSRRTLPFAGGSDTIRVFRQALSLDECRVKFSPNLYHRLVAPVTPPLQTRSLLTRIAQKLSIFEKRRRNPDTPRVPLVSKQRAGLGKKSGFKEDVKEVWFAGSHSDIGGGLAKDTDENALSNIPLRWMLREIVKARCNVRFDEAAFQLWNIPITTIQEATVTREASGSTLRNDESELALAQDMRDALSMEETDARTSQNQHKGPKPLSPSMQIEESLDAPDALEIMGNAFIKNPFWWILEIIPTYHEWQNDIGEWVGKWRIHFARGREVPTDSLFHESVRTRMNNPILKYSPKAQYKKGTEKYVS